VGVSTVSNMLIAADDVLDVPGELSGVGSWSPLEVLLECEPSPAAVNFATGIDPDSLNGAQKMALLKVLERQQCWLAERAAAITASIAGPSATAGDDDWNRELVAATLGLTTGAAAMRVDVARRLAHDLPACRAAMAAGEMSYYHACVIAQAVSGLDPEATAEVDGLVAGRIAGQAWVTFRRTLRAAVLRAAPDGARAAHERAVRDRTVERTYLDDGMAGVTATMAAVDAQTVSLGLDKTATTLRNLARAAGEVDAGIGAYRSDALVAWANAVLNGEDLTGGQLSGGQSNGEQSNGDQPKGRRRNTGHRRRMPVGVVVDLPTLLGLADNPGELIGYGSIAAPLARMFAADGEWRRLVVDPVTGHLLDFGSVIYRPPQALADFILARDRTCRFPACGRQAVYCDIDHTVPAPAGPTSAANCCCLCRRHHRAKTVGDWVVELRPDGSCLWTAPTGTQFVVDPPTQLP
jgi:Domain of unknown function (DUF222)